MMSSSFVRDCSDFSGTGCSGSSKTVIIIVNSDSGNISLDENELQNLLTSHGADTASQVSVVQMGPGSGVTGALTIPAAAASYAHNLISENGVPLNFTLDGYPTIPIEASNVSGYAELPLDADALKRLESVLETDEAKEILGEPLLNIVNNPDQLVEPFEQMMSPSGEKSSSCNNSSSKSKRTPPKRRSQRQMDKAEREEVEKILAENQRMLRQERELLRKAQDEAQMQEEEVEEKEEEEDKEEEATVKANAFKEKKLMKLNKGKGQEKGGGEGGNRNGGKQVRVKGEKKIPSDPKSKKYLKKPPEKESNESLSKKGVKKNLDEIPVKKGAKKSLVNVTESRKAVKKNSVDEPKFKKILKKNSIDKMKSNKANMLEKQKKILRKSAGPKLKTKSAKKIIVVQSPADKNNDSRVISMKKLSVQVKKLNEKDLRVSNEELPCNLTDDASPKGESRPVEKPKAEATSQCIKIAEENQRLKESPSVVSHPDSTHGTMDESPSSPSRADNGSPETGSNISKIIVIKQKSPSKTENFRDNCKDRSSQNLQSEIAVDSRTCDSNILSGECNSDIIYNSETNTTNSLISNKNFSDVDPKNIANEPLSSQTVASTTSTPSPQRRTIRVVTPVEGKEVINIYSTPGVLKKASPEVKNKKLFTNKNLNNIGKTSVNRKTEKTAKKTPLKQGDSLSKKTKDSFEKQLLMGNYPNKAAKNVALKINTKSDNSSVTGPKNCMKQSPSISKSLMNYKIPFKNTVVKRNLDFKENSNPSLTNNVSKESDTNPLLSRINYLKMPVFPHKTPDNPKCPVSSQRESGTPSSKCLTPCNVKVNISNSIPNPSEIMKNNSLHCESSNFQKTESNHTVVVKVKSASDSVGEVQPANTNVERTLTTDGPSVLSVNGRDNTISDTVRKNALNCSLGMASKSDSKKQGTLQDSAASGVMMTTESVRRSERPIKKKKFSDDILYFDVKSSLASEDEEEEREDEEGDSNADIDTDEDAPLVGDKDSSSESEMEADVDDDPERLWCICQKPHNNRFMICCDRCEDWFHGSCVGITKQMGKRMEEEEKEWICPNCKKAERAIKGLASTPLKKTNLKAKHRKRLVLKTLDKNTSIHDQKVPLMDRTTGVFLPAEARPTVANLSLFLAEHPEYTFVTSDMLAAVTTDPETGRDMVPLEKFGLAPAAKSRKGSKDTSFQDFIDSADSSASQKKEKTYRTTKLIEVADVPKSEKKLAKKEKRDTEKSSEKKSEKSSPKKIGSSSFYKKEKGDSARKSWSEKVDESASNKKSSKEVKKVPKPENNVDRVIVKSDSIIKVRTSVQKMLFEALEKRRTECRTDFQELTSDHMKNLCKEIEEQLYLVFNKDVGFKYKSRYRSLVFNIRDTKNNGLFRNILNGTIPPEKLACMTSEEMASKELIEWREKEEKKELEAIQKHELERLALGDQYIMKSHKGEIVIDKDELGAKSKDTESVINLAPEPSKVIPAADLQEDEEMTNHKNHIYDPTCKLCTAGSSFELQDVTLSKEQSEKQHLTKESENETNEKVRDSSDSSSSKQRKRQRDRSRERHHKHKHHDKNRHKNKRKEKYYSSSEDDITERSRHRSGSRRRSKDRREEEEESRKHLKHRSSRDEDQERRRSRDSHHHKRKHRDSRGDDRKRRDSGDSHRRRESHDDSQHKSHKREKERERERKESEREKRDIEIEKEKSPKRKLKEMESEVKKDHLSGESKVSTSEDVVFLSQSSSQKPADRARDVEPTFIVAEIPVENGAAAVNMSPADSVPCSDDVENGDSKSAASEKVKAENILPSYSPDISPSTPPLPADAEVEEAFSPATPPLPDDDDDDSDRLTPPPPPTNKKETPEALTQSSVWKGYINMVDVARFAVASFEVSGRPMFATGELPLVMEIVGRIPPDTVWSYLAQQKKSGSKEILVLRFQPANEDDKSSYISFYSYLSSKRRYGVVGNCAKTIRDFYIVPLASHQPIPQILLPLDGPGFEERRPHMLIGVLIRAKRRKVYDPITETWISNEAPRQRSQSIDLLDEKDPPLDPDECIDNVSYTPPTVFGPEDQFDKTSQVEEKQDLEVYSPPSEEGNILAEDDKTKVVEDEDDRMDRDTMLAELNRQIEKDRKELTEMQRKIDKDREERESQKQETEKDSVSPSGLGSDNLPLDTSKIDIPSNLHEILNSIKLKEEAIKEKENEIKRRLNMAQDESKVAVVSGAQDVDLRLLFPQTTDHHITSVKTDQHMNAGQDQDMRLQKVMISDQDLRLRDPRILRTYGGSSKQDIRGLSLSSMSDEDLMAKAKEMEGPVEEEAEEEEEPSFSPPPPPLDHLHPQPLLLRPPPGSEVSGPPVYRSDGLPPPYGPAEQLPSPSLPQRLPDFEPHFDYNQSPKGPRPSHIRVPPPLAERPTESYRDYASYPPGYEGPSSDGWNNPGWEPNRRGRRNHNEWNPRCDNGWDNRGYQWPSHHVMPSDRYHHDHARRNRRWQEGRRPQWGDTERNRSERGDWRPTPKRMRREDQGNSSYEHEEEEEIREIDY